MAIFILVRVGFVVVLGIGERALVELDVGHRLRHALRRALLAAAPVNVPVISLVADVAEAVDDEFWVASLARDEVEVRGSFVVHLRRLLAPAETFNEKSREGNQWKFVASFPFPGHQKAIRVELILIFIDLEG
jgi:hypothetical protein